MRRGAGLAAAFVCATLATGAWAGQNQHPTFFVKFEFKSSTSSQERFKGKIDSRKSKCVKGRKVVLYRKRSGDKKKIGADKTNDKGKFSIGVGNGPPKDGKYFAKAKASSYTGGSGDKITCLEEDSARVTIG